MDERPLPYDPSMARDDDASPFKRCSMCGQAWPSREALLADPAIEPLGYQASVSDGVLGLFLFNHLSCGTTLAVRADGLASLHDGPVYRDPGSPRDRPPEPQGPGTCLTHEAGEPCPDRCECEFVGAVLARVETWPKDA